MKQRIPGWVAAVIMIGVILVVGLVFIKVDRGSKDKAQMIEGLIRATASGPTGAKGGPAPQMPEATPKAR